jgi:hypothetical protein
MKVLSFIVYMAELDKSLQNILLYDSVGAPELAPFTHVILCFHWILLLNRFFRLLKTQGAVIHKTYYRQELVLSL